MLNDQRDPKVFMATYNPRPDDTGEFIVVCSIVDCVPHLQFINVVNAFMSDRMQL